MTKLRTDSFAAGLSEEQAWTLYAKARSLPWYEAAKWAVREYGVSAPGRSAFYKWVERMREEESAHRLREVAIANAEAGRLAESRTDDSSFIAALKTLAAELTLSRADGSAKEALRLVQMASSLSDRRLKAEELRLKAAAQETRDAALRLEREKFEAAERRENAAKSALGDTKLTDADKIAKMKEIFG